MLTESHCIVCLSVFVASSASDIVSKIVGIYVVLSAFGKRNSLDHSDGEYSPTLPCVNSRHPIRARCRGHVHHPHVSSSRSSSLDSVDAGITGP